MSDPRPSRLPRWLVGSGVIAVAMAVMNVTTYGFTILAARLLGPEEYGALAAVMGLLLVVNVASLGLQATGARRVSARPGDLPHIEAEVLATSYRSSVALGVLLLALAPLVTTVLSLDSVTTATMVALTAVPLTVMGGQAGILQGERRWAPLAGIYLGVGLGRIGFGLAGLVWEPSTFGAMAGVAVGAVVPAVVGYWALSHPSRLQPHRPAFPPGRSRAPSSAAPSSAAPVPPWASGGVARETLHNSHALLAFFALSNVDVLIARTVLDERQAGLYAGGLILTKAVLFLPQFVVVIVFPSMSSAASARRLNLAALGAVLVMGLCTVAGTAALAGLAVTFVGGPEYAALGSRLWVFAVLGTVLAMLQLMVYNLVARQRPRAVYAIWAALAVLLVAGPLMGSVSVLVVTVVVVDLCLFVLLLLRAGVRSHQAATPRTPARV